MIARIVLPKENVCCMMQIDSLIAQMAKIYYNREASTV